MTTRQQTSFIFGLILETSLSLNSYCVLGDFVKQEFSTECEDLLKAQG